MDLSGEGTFLTLFKLTSQKKCKKLVVIGGGYIGMEVAAAASAWNLDTTVE